MKEITLNLLKGNFVLKNYKFLCFIFLFYSLTVSAVTDCSSDEASSHSAQIYEFPTIVVMTTSDKLKANIGEKVHALKFVEHPNCQEYLKVESCDFRIQDILDGSRGEVKGENCRPLVDGRYFSLDAFRTMSRNAEYKADRNQKQMRLMLAVITAPIGFGTYSATSYVLRSLAVKTIASISVKSILAFTLSTFVEGIVALKIDDKLSPIVRARHELPKGKEFVNSYIYLSDLTSVKKQEVLLNRQTHDSYFFDVEIKAKNEDCNNCFNLSYDWLNDFEIYLRDRSPRGWE
jgi:hypothetical protein